MEAKDMLEKIQEVGGKHLALHAYPFLVNTMTLHYSVICAACQASINWKVKDGEDPFEGDNKKVLAFAEAHRHHAEFPKLSQPVFDHDNVLTASKIKSTVEKLKNPILMVHPKMAEDLAKDTSLGLLGDIQINFHGQNRITAVSSLILKHVAKLSDFNVDIQANRRHYRLYCGKCFEEMPLEREQVLTLDKGGYPEVDGFLLTHRHDALPVPEGRKFR